MIEAGRDTISCLFQIPFREAHSVSGQIVKRSEQLNCQLSEVPLSELRKIR